MNNDAIETTLLRIETLRAELAAQPETTAECCALTADLEYAYERLEALGYYD